MLKYIIGITFVVTISASVAELNRERRVGGDNTHYCCEVQVTDVIRNFTQRIPVQFYKNVSYTLRNGTRYCEHGETPVSWDLTGSYCENTVTVYREELAYRMENVVKSVYEKGVCPDQHIICCPGFQLFKGNCLTDQEIKGLSALSGLEGLLGRRRR